MLTKHCHRSLQQGAVFPIQPELIGLGGEHKGESEQPLIKLNEDLINPTSDDWLNIQNYMSEQHHHLVAIIVHYYVCMHM